MGRPEPCVLFAHSFVHSQLDEYADEVLFAEPVVITACEFLEQNASPSTPNISLVGATSPPSFALEIFIHCEGESRFRRLCQPFLYSHSSSSVLEVEAVVTNHLVLRGSYRSLTLVVYGNTAEDLGQFNIEFDLDSSLANAVRSPPEGKFEDLPSALCLTKLTFEESISSIKALCCPVPELEIAPELKKFLQLILKVLQVSDHENTLHKVVDSVVSAVSSDVHNDSNVPASWDKQNLCKGSNKGDSQQVVRILSEARNELLKLYKIQQPASVDNLSLEDELYIGSDDMVGSELLIDMFNQCFPCFGKTGGDALSVSSEKKSLILGLGVALLLCTCGESCFCFVTSGAMEQIVNLLSPENPKSTAVALLLLGVVERATRHAMGCEGFLGWWPREDEDVPIGNSDGYCHLLKLLLEKQRHDVASLVTYVLHRLRFYEVASRYESAVLSVLAHLSVDSQIAKDEMESLITASSLLKQILKLLDFLGPIEDPSPLASARKLYLDSQPEGLLSYGATVDIIGSCKYSFEKWDIDTHLLFLLKERGFFPLSAALLSSPILRSADGSTADVFLEIATSIESLLLKLLFSRSGLTFLLIQPEATALLVLSLQDLENTSKMECMTLRQAAVFLSKGFVCRPQEIGMIIELHLRVGTAIDRILVADPHSDDFLWVLWELCAISRSDSGRQALLALCHFPEAVRVLMEALRSFKSLDPSESGSSSLSLAIFHFAAEIFEIMVTDSTASSLKCWIEHAVELHKALHLSSPGSNRKDAPTRLLEWIDAGVVYHRNGAVGLLRYAAVLVSGGDAHLTSASVLVSDSIDVENVLGDSTNSSDDQVVDNMLGKLVSDKYFEGISFRDASVVQLTTTFRILAFISENSVVAASLFEEGALTLIYVVLVNCKLMLERSSNTYDYLVDEGAECNSTSDLLSGRSHEQSLVDLMIPCLVLLINLLHKLQEAKEQYRNKKLLNTLLHLHREISPRMVACAADLSYPYPSSALAFGAVCHLISSALACWPVFGWSPGLFHCLLGSVQAASSLALGPKDACSMFCLLGDLLPEEGIWLWKNEMPPLSALKTLSVGTVLGPQAEGHINWYQRPEHLSVLLVRLTPQLDRIAQIVLHLAFTALVAIQDMLRVFIIRMACQRTECAVVLLRPVVSWMEICVNNTSLSDIDIFKVHRFLCFLASLLEHPRSKTLLLKVGAMQILEKVLQRCSDAFCSDEKLILDEGVFSKNVSLLSWSLPVFRCLALIYSSQTSMCRSQVCCDDNIRIEESCLVSRHLLQLCQVLPVGQELLTCIVTLKEIASCGPGRGAILSIFSQIHSSLQEHKLDQEGTNGGLPSDYYWGMSPFLNCLKKLLRSLESKDSALTIVVETVYALSLCTIYVSKEGKSSGGVSVLKSLYGLPNDLDDSSVSSDEKLNDVVELLRRIQQMIAENEYLTASNWTTTLNQVKDSVEAVLLLLQSTAGASSTMKGIALSEGSNFPSDIVHSVIITSKLMPSLTKISMDDKPTLSFSHVWKSNENAEKVDDDFAIGSLAEKFVWECPYTLPERPLMPALPSKRKLLAAEGSGKRARENIGSEAIGSNALVRGLSTANASSGPTRRDTFRQRKPNTSRPPSMHVDDYVARERNIDGVSSGLNIVSSQRVTSTSGRPPSIHVDEFMARQRERQKPMPGTNGDTSQVRNSSFENAKDPDKLDRSRQLKLDPDDDLQGIDIVFDEESESDDRLPFPQPDDNMQPAPVVIGDSSPGSVVEETEGDTIEGTRISHLNTPPASEDGGSHSDLALRRPVYRTEIPVAQEASVSSEKNLKVVGIEKLIFHEQSDESKYISPVGGLKGSEMLPTSNLTVFPPSLFNPVSTSSSVPPLLPPSYHQRGSPQKSADASVATRSHGYSEQKIPINQPPLPPMPPPTLAAVPVQSADQTASHSSPYVHSLRDAQPPIPSGYPLQHFDVSGINTVTGLHLRSENLPSSGSSSISSLSTAQPILDSKYSWNMVSSAAFSSSVSARPMPPLPPTPPPFSSSIAQAIASNSNPQNSSYNQVANVGVQPPLPSTPISDARLGILSASGTSLASYSLPPYTPPSLTSRPTSVPGTQFSSPSQKQSQNSPSLSQPVPSPLLSIQSIQPRPPPPPPPPQLPRPLNLPQQPGPFIHPQSEQGIPMQQSTIQVQVQPLQVQQQLHMPQIQFYYQQQQQEPLLQPLQPLLEQAQLQNTNIPFDNAAQQESGMTLQQYFSPEAIQALLRDRDKLCQLLEQHPKLMQMLQERLGQQ